MRPQAIINWQFTTQDARTKTPSTISLYSQRD